MDTGYFEHRFLTETSAATASVSARASKTERYATNILHALMRTYTGPVAIRLWNEKPVIGKPAAPCTLVFRHPRALRDLVLHRDIMRLAESHLEGAIDVEGDMELLFGLGVFLQQTGWSLKQRLTALWNALRLPSGPYRKTTPAAGTAPRPAANSKHSIAHHYDVGNDFYHLWLDPEMVYSCAYFRDSRQSLASAQEDKLDYICRKLRLEPGRTLLDIGCGWGALLLWAARRYGVRAHGITLSEEQYRYARQRIRAEGMGEQLTVELRDYRDLPDQPQYDRIVSVGMFEHIGRRNFELYFKTVRRLLKPDGLFLNHGITSDSGWKRTPLTRFINRYIFPDGELARISDVHDAMEKAGFELLDVESLRRHYALTLRHWVKSLELHSSQAIQATDDRTYRLWRLYMAGCACYFERGNINIYQVLAGQVGSSLPTPLRRDDLYCNRAPGLYQA